MRPEFSLSVHTSGLRTKTKRKINYHEHWKLLITMLSRIAIVVLNCFFCKITPYQVKNSSKCSAALGKNKTRSKEEVTVKSGKDTERGKKRSLVIGCLTQSKRNPLIDECFKLMGMANVCYFF